MTWHYKSEFKLVVHTDSEISKAFPSLLTRIWNTRLNLVAEQLRMGYIYHRGMSDCALEQNSISIFYFIVFTI